MNNQFLFFPTNHDIRSKTLHFVGVSKSGFVYSENPLDIAIVKTEEVNVFDISSSEDPKNHPFFAHSGLVKVFSLSDRDYYICSPEMDLEPLKASIKALNSTLYSLHKQHMAGFDLTGVAQTIARDRFIEKLMTTEQDTGLLSHDLNMSNDN